MRNARELYRMRVENIDWNNRVIFNPNSKTKKGRSASAPTVVRGRDLSAAQVNEISRLQGLGICWQPGNIYRICRTANEKSCLSQFDLHGREL